MIPVLRQQSTGSSLPLVLRGGYAGGEVESDALDGELSAGAELATDGDVGAECAAQLGASPELPFDVGVEDEA